MKTKNAFTVKRQEREARDGLMCSKDEERKKIQIRIDEFIANGGKIQILKRGVSGWKE